MGDSDTTGSIAGGLYGLVYGIDNVGEHLLEHLEYYDELKVIGIKLFEKYKK
jgi:ADP-ribosylglycohydrolase